MSTKALKANVPTIKSADLPEPESERKWKDFDDFAQAAANLAESRQAEHLEWRDAEWVTAVRADCRKWLAEYDPRANYDADGDLKRGKIGKQLGIMLLAFPHSNPSNGPGYLRLMTEHVSAVPGLTTLALETACREIELTELPFGTTPTVAYVVKFVRKAVETWERRCHVISGFCRFGFEVDAEREAQKAAKRAKRMEVSDA